MAANLETVILSRRSDLLLKADTNIHHAIFLFFSLLRTNCVSSWLSRVFFGRSLNSTQRCLFSVLKTLALQPRRPTTRILQFYLQSP
jgi:hypothetical protein